MEILRNRKDHIDMVKLLILISTFIFFFSSCDNAHNAVSADEDDITELSETDEMDEDATDTDSYHIEFTEIIMSRVLNEISQKAELDVADLRVKRNFNHVDTSFSIHKDDLGSVTAILEKEIAENGCGDCSEDENYLLAVTSENMTCCIYDRSVTDEIAKYLLIPINSMFWPFATQNEPHPVGHTSVNIQHYTENYEEAYFHH